MASQHTLFRVFYRLGFTPWDGHPLAQSLRDLIEGTNDTPRCPRHRRSNSDAVPATARSTWPSTAGRSPRVDFVPSKRSTRPAPRPTPPALSVDFVRADVTQLSSGGLGDNFGLIVDNGCLHNMSDGDRDAYVREVSAMAAPGRAAADRRVPSRRQVRCAGRRPAEMERRFSPGWTLLSAGDERELDAEQTPTRYYLFQRSA